MLTAKTPVSSDTKIFTFALDHPGQRIGLPVGQHLMMRLRDPVTREAIVRAYTPLSDPVEEAEGETAVGRGKLDVLVKIYRPSADGRRPGGAMTPALDSLPLGHWVDLKGPVGRFEYLGRGRCSVGGAGADGPRTVRRFVMVCAGSGVTPILAVLRAVAADAEDATRCVVLDGNRSEEDILCRRALDDARAAAAATRARDDGGGGGGGGGEGPAIRVVHTLTQPGPAWTGGRGRMDAALFEREVGPPGPGRDEMVLVCGPGPMERVVRESFAVMGWREEDLFFF